MAKWTNIRIYREMNPGQTQNFLASSCVLVTLSLSSIWPYSPFIINLSISYTPLLFPVYCLSFNLIFISSLSITFLLPSLSLHLPFIFGLSISYTLPPTDLILFFLFKSVATPPLLREKMSINK